MMRKGTCLWLCSIPHGRTEKNARFRFIEVSEAIVSDERRESRFRIVIKHATGASETFESGRRAKQATIPCHT